MAIIDMIAGLFALKASEHQAKSRQDIIWRAKLRAGEKWEEEHNALPFIEANRVFRYVRDNMDEVTEYLLQGPFASEEEEKKVRNACMYKIGLIVVEMYSLKKYGKNCYPSGSRERNVDYAAKVDFAEWEVKWERGWL